VVKLEEYIKEEPEENPKEELERLLKAESKDYPEDHLEDYPENDPQNHAKERQKNMCPYCHFSSVVKKPASVRNPTMPGHLYLKCSRKECNKFTSWSNAHLPKDGPHIYGECPKSECDGFRVQYWCSPNNIENAGRPYFNCSDDDCRYFAWADTE
jgi:hypothetical protein